METTKEESILRQGDGIVLDWTNEGFDALFGGNQRDNELRGQPSYNNVKVLTDPEAVAKRQEQAKLKAAGVTLDQCLDEFSKEEVLSRGDAWYCPRCKKHVQAHKKFQLWKAPDVLVIQLKRFTQARSFRSKLDTLVKFPLENLDLNGRVEGPEDGKSLEYDLFAIDNHLGGLGGGHYTAYIKDFLTGEWNHCNGKLFNLSHGGEPATDLSRYPRSPCHTAFIYDFLQCLSPILPSSFRSSIGQPGTAGNGGVLQDSYG